MDPVEQLGRDMARAAGRPERTVTAQVIDLTETGGVNLDIQGALVLDVPCADSYRNRTAGDLVMVRLGPRPMVLYRRGPDPVATEEDRIRSLADEVAADLQQVRALTWGTGAPAGSGWQQATEVHVRNVGGKGEMYVRVAAVTDPSPGTPATRPPKTVSIAPTAQDSWRSGRRDDYRSVPTQGDWTGGGNLRGGWFYGTQIAAACSGKTVASMKVAFTRKTGSGYNARRPLHLYLHDFTSPPSGQLTLGTGPEELLSLSVGATGTATLPASWRSALASGSARGLAIYAQGKADYMAVSGGRITITFSA